MKTQKEKAKELVERFTFFCRECDFEDNAKQCALISVDEIIEETKLHDKTVYEHGRTFYWQEVKQEILNTKY